MANKDFHKNANTHTGNVFMTRDLHHKTGADPEIGFGGISSVCFSVPKAQIVFGKFLGAGDAAYLPRRGGGIAQRGRSVISTIALCDNAFCFHCCGTISK